MFAISSQRTNVLCTASKRFRHDRGSRWTEIVHEPFWKRTHAITKLQTWSTFELLWSLAMRLLKANTKPLTELSCDREHDFLRLCSARNQNGKQTHQFNSVMLIEYRIMSGLTLMKSKQSQNKCSCFFGVIYLVRRVVNRHFLSSLLCTFSPGVVLRVAWFEPYRSSGQKNEAIEPWQKYAYRFHAIYLNKLKISSSQRESHAQTEQRASEAAHKTAFQLTIKTWKGALGLAYLFSYVAAF